MNTLTSVQQSKRQSLKMCIIHYGGNSLHFCYLSFIIEKMIAYFSVTKSQTHGSNNITNEK